MRFILSSLRLLFTIRDTGWSRSLDSIKYTQVDPRGFDSFITTCIKRIEKYIHTYIRKFDWICRTRSLQSNLHICIHAVWVRVPVLNSILPSKFNNSYQYLIPLHSVSLPDMSLRPSLPVSITVFRFLAKLIVRIHSNSNGTESED